MGVEPIQSFVSDKRSNRRQTQLKCMRVIMHRLDEEVK